MVESAGRRVSRGLWMIDGLLRGGESKVQTGMFLSLDINTVPIGRRGYLERGVFLSS